MVHNVVATIFCRTMTLIATSLFCKADSLSYGDYSTSDLMHMMIPGFYTSMLATLSLHYLTKVVRHPHDVRTSELQLRKARKIKNMITKPKHEVKWHVVSIFYSLHFFLQCFSKKLFQSDYSLCCV